MATGDRPPSPNPRQTSAQVYLTRGLALGNALLRQLDSKSRLGVSLMVGMGVFLLIPNNLQLDLHLLAGWISGILCFLTLVVLMMNTATPAQTRYRAQRQEAQHLAVFLLVVIAACTSIFAIALMQSNNDSTSQSTSEILLALETALSLVAVVCSWFLAHTMFALHYATCFYRRDLTTETGDAGGLDFPGADPPDYWDFMYFSFTIGMTAQTSDVSIPSSFLRRLAIAHAVVAFFFYMVILASGVNVASGLI